MAVEFRTRFKREPIAERGEPCPHGGSPIDCAECHSVMVAGLPALAATRCREHLVEDLRVVKAHCMHGASKGRGGRALVCERCGWAGHQWQSYICGRGRPKPGEIEAENERCPVHERLLDQKSQRVPA